MHISSFYVPINNVQATCINKSDVNGRPSSHGKLFKKYLLIQIGPKGGIFLNFTLFYVYYK